MGAAEPIPIAAPLLIRVPLLPLLLLPLPLLLLLLPLLALCAFTLVIVVGQFPALPILSLLLPVDTLICFSSLPSSPYDGRSGDDEREGTEEEEDEEEGTEEEEDEEEEEEENKSDFRDTSYSVRRWKCMCEPRASFRAKRRSHPW